MEGVDVTALIASVGRRLVQDRSVNKNQRASLALCQLELLIRSMVLLRASECHSCGLGITNKAAVDRVFYSRDNNTNARVSASLS